MTMMMPTQPMSQPDFPDQAQLDRMLSKTRAKMFFMPGASWLGTLLCSHNLIWDPYCPTAWCDGKTIAFCPEFFVRLGQDQRVTLLAHELFHTMLDHSGRIGNRDPELWNMAADYVINLDLERMGYSFQDMNPLLDAKYVGMTTEEVYDSLVQKNVVPPKMMALICPEEGKTGDKDSQDPGNGPAQGSSGQGDIPTLCGDLRKPADGASRQEVLAKVVQAAQAAHMAKDAGSLPGEVQQIIDEFLDPVLPWETLLMRYFNEMSQDDYSWKQPSRRYQDDYLPTMLDDNGLDHLIYYLDVSGSITDAQALRFFSEVRFIHQQLKPKQLTLVTFDTAIQDTYDFFEDDPFEKIVINGRGGTSLDKVYHHIHETRPTAAVIFSDLYVHPMTRDPGSPVLWVIMDNKKAVTHFGTRIHLNKEQIG